MNTLLILAVGLVGSCYCYMELLQPYDVQAQMMFAAEDLNQDGVMTADEIKASLLKFDSNGNGKVSRHDYTEFVCAVNPLLYNLSHYLYDEYDASGDHSLDEGDFAAFHALMDKDGDGLVTEQEFVDYWVAVYTKYENMEAHKELHLHGHSKCH